MDFLGEDLVVDDALTARTPPQQQRGERSSWFNVSDVIEGIAFPSPTLCVASRKPAEEVAHRSPVPMMMGGVASPRTIRIPGQFTLRNLPDDLLTPELELIFGPGAEASTQQQQPSSPPATPTPAPAPPPRRRRLLDSPPLIPPPRPPTEEAVQCTSPPTGVTVQSPLTLESPIATSPEEPLSPVSVASDGVGQPSPLATRRVFSCAAAQTDEGLAAILLRRHQECLIGAASSVAGDLIPPSDSVTQPSKEEEEEVVEEEKLSDASPATAAAPSTETKNRAATIRERIRVAKHEEVRQKVELSQRRVSFGESSGLTRSKSLPSVARSLPAVAKSARLMGRLTGRRSTNSTGSTGGHHEDDIEVWRTLEGYLDPRTTVEQRKRVKALVMAALTTERNQLEPRPRQVQMQWLRREMWPESYGRTEDLMFGV